MYKPVVGFELYEINECGDIRNKQRNKPLKSHVNHQGYLQVLLRKDGKHHCCRVNRLVYEAFIGKVPAGFQVNHINEDKTDNRLSNLNLMSPKENCNYGTRNDKIGEKNSKPVLQINSIGIVIREWPSMMEAERNGYTASSIARCCKGERASHAGFTWKYKSEQ